MKRSVITFRPLVTMLTVLALAGPAASTASATELCFGDDVTDHGRQVTHPNLNDGDEVYAGTIKAYIDGDFVRVYCVDLDHGLCDDTCYEQGPDVSDDRIVWILQNYYPYVPGQPAALTSQSKRAAAVQLAIWHFSDGLNISSGGTPSDVFNAARAIIAVANSASVPETPTTLTLAQANQSLPFPGNASVTATVLDQNAAPLAGVNVHFEVTGAHAAAGDVVTDASGHAVFQYAGTTGGKDEVSAVVDYDVPIGLSWVRDGCQTVIIGDESKGRLAAKAKVDWELIVPVRPTTWSSLKNRLSN